MYQYQGYSLPSRHIFGKHIVKLFYFCWKMLKIEIWIGQHPMCMPNIEKQKSYIILKISTLKSLNKKSLRNFEISKVQNFVSFFYLRICLKNQSRYFQNALTFLFFNIFPQKFICDNLWGQGYKDLDFQMILRSTK